MTSLLTWAKKRNNWSNFEGNCYRLSNAVCRIFLSFLVSEIEVEVEISPPPPPLLRRVLPAGVPRCGLSVLNHVHLIFTHWSDVATTSQMQSCMIAKTGRCFHIVKVHRYHHGHRSERISQKIPNIIPRLGIMQRDNEGGATNILFKIPTSTFSSTLHNSSQPRTSSGPWKQRFALTQTN